MKCLIVRLENTSLKSPHISLPRLPEGLDVFLGLHPEGRDAGVARVRFLQDQLVHETRAGVGRCRRTYRAYVGELLMVGR